jgi:hypothetical protein
VRGRIQKKGRQVAKPNRPGFAGSAAKRAAVAYRNDTGAAIFPAFSLSRPTHAVSGDRSMPARQESTNPAPAMARRLKTVLADTLGLSRQARMATDADSRRWRD